MKQSKFLSIFFVFFWVLGSNLPVTESLFSSLHDLVEHHHDSNSNDGQHTHHSDLHTCHALTHNHNIGNNESHNHQSFPKHQPHDECCIKTVAIIGSSSVQKDKHYSSSTFPIALTYFIHSPNYESEFVISTSNSIRLPKFENTNVVSPRAPPFSI